MILKIYMDSNTIHSIKIKASSVDSMVFMSVSSMLDLKTKQPKIKLEDTVTKFFAHIQSTDIHVLSQYSEMIKDIRLDNGAFYTNIDYIKSHLDILIKNGTYL